MGSQVVDQTPHCGYNFAGFIFTLEGIPCFKRLREGRSPDVLESLVGKVQHGTFYE